MDESKLSLLRPNIGVEHVPFRLSAMHYGGDIHR